MKRFHVLLTALVLAFSLMLCAMALAEENGDSALTVGQWGTVRPLLNQFADEDGVNLYIEDMLADVWIDEEVYHTLEKRYGGAPEWSFSQEGSDIRTALHIEDEGNSRHISMHLEQVPSEPVDITYTVNSDWGDYHDSASFNVSFIEIDSYPESLNIEESIDLEVGVRKQIDFSLTPADWKLPEERMFLVATSPDMGQECEYEDGKLYITANKPGFFSAYIIMKEGDMLCLRKGVTFNVTGKAADSALTFRQMSQVKPLLNQFWDDGKNPLHIEEMLGDAWVDENKYRSLEERYGGAPEWSLSQEGSDIRTSLHLWDEVDPQHISILIEQVPSEPVDIIYTVNCDWGDYHDSFAFKVSFVKVDSYPESLNIDDTIDLKVGVRKQIKYSLTPANWSLTKDRWFDVSTFYGDMEAQCEYQNGKLYLTANKPGVYYGSIFMREGNMLSLEKRNIRFNVTGEDGAGALTFRQMSKVKPLLNQFWDDGKNPLHIEEMLGDAFLGDEMYRMLEERYGGALEWSLSQEGSDIRTSLHLWDEVDPQHIFILIEQVPSEPVDIIYTVNCDWGDYHDSFAFKVSFVKVDSYPESLNIDDVIDLKVGVRKQIKYSLTPANWKLTKDRWFDISTMNGDMEAQCEYQNGKLYLTANKPGVYYGSIFMREGNMLSLEKRIIRFNVADKNGKVKDITRLELPENLVRIEAEAFRGIDANEVIVPDSCKYIGSRAFADCHNLLYVHLPAKVEVAGDAFEGCGDIVIDRWWLVGNGE